MLVTGWHAYFPCTYQTWQWIRPACACALTASGVAAHAHDYFPTSLLETWGCDDTVVSRRRSFTSVRTTTLSFGRSTCFLIDLVVSPRLSMSAGECQDKKSYF